MQGEAATRKRHGNIRVHAFKAMQKPDAPMSSVSTTKLPDLTVAEKDMKGRVSPLGLT